MHPFLARILDKPVCAILDGCQNFYNKLGVAYPSLFGPTVPENSLQLRYRIKNAKCQPPQESQPPKKPQRRIMREPVTVPNHKPLHRYLLDGIDYVYQYSRIHGLKRKIFENIQLRSTNEWLKAQNKEPDLDVKFTEIDLPSDHRPYTLYDYMGELLFPATKEEIDGFVMLPSDGNGEDIFYV